MAKKEETSHNEKHWTDIGLLILTGVIAVSAMVQYASFRNFSKKNSRAYLSVVNPILDTLYAYGKSNTRVTFTIQNTGKTPAYEVRQNILFKHQWKSVGPIIPDTTNHYRYIYAPGEIQHTLLGQVETLQQSTVPGDKLRLFFSGRISYSDIFEQSHWLTFAYEYVWRKEIGGKFESYPQYNDTDKN